MSAFLCLTDFEKSLLYFSSDEMRRAWMQGLISRLRVSYSDSPGDIDWIMMYALCLYLKQKFQGRLPALVLEFKVSN